MNTKEYMYLKKRINKLKKIFLPKKFSPTGSYSDNVLEKSQAYALLSHSEFEFYFEQTALQIAQKSFKCWTTTKLTTRPLVAMIAYYSGSFNIIPESKIANSSKENLDVRINKAFGEYNYVINNNHGIKGKNIFRLFIPIGLELNQFDDSFLLALDVYGHFRGQIAHSTRATNLKSPDDIFADTVTLLGYIKCFDENIIFPIV